MRLVNLIIFTTPAFVSPFGVKTSRQRISKNDPHSDFYWREQWLRTTLYSSAPKNSDSDNEEVQKETNGLVLDGLEKEMGKMSSKFSFSESDFLASARKRAEQRVESKNEAAGDTEWQTLAEEKKTEFGEIDDWDNSMKEAGNQDSQILMFTDPPADEDDNSGGDSEPKLLLF